MINSKETVIRSAKLDYMLRLLQIFTIKIYLTIRIQKISARVLIFN